MYPYQCYRESGGQVGLSLPKWLTPPKAVRQAVGSVLKSTRISVPTPVGPIELTPEQIAAGARGATITVSSRQQPPEGPVQSVQRAIDSIPGGWLTIGALAVAGVFVLPKLIGARR